MTNLLAAIAFTLAILASIAFTLSGDTECEQRYGASLLGLAPTPEAPCP